MIKLVQFFRLKSSLRLFRFIDLRGCTGSTRLTFVFNVSLISFEGSFLLLVFLDLLGRGASLDNFLGVPLLLNSLNEHFSIILKAKPEIGISNLLVTYETIFLTCDSSRVIGAVHSFAKTESKVVLKDD